MITWLNVSGAEFYIFTCKVGLPLECSLPTATSYIVRRNKFHFSDESFRHPRRHGHNSQTIKIGIYFNVGRSTQLFLQWCDEFFLFLFLFSCVSIQIAVDAGVFPDSVNMLLLVLVWEHYRLKLFRFALLKDLPSPLTVSRNASWQHTSS
jgi:hypothetical protein